MQEMEATRLADQLLEGLDYPIGKQGILQAAAEAKLTAPTMKALEAIPDREYEDREDVTRALNSAV